MSVRSSVGGWLAKKNSCGWMDAPRDQRPAPRPQSLSSRYGCKAPPRVRACTHTRVRSLAGSKGVQAAADRVLNIPQKRSLSRSDFFRPGHLPGAIRRPTTMKLLLAAATGLAALAAATSANAQASAQTAASPTAANIKVSPKAKPAIAALQQAVNAGDQAQFQPWCKPRRRLPRPRKIAGSSRSSSFALQRQPRTTPD